MLPVLRLVYFWLFLILVVVLVLFGYQNQEFVDLKVPFLASYRVRLVEAMVLSFIAGATLISVFFGYGFTRKSWEIQKLRRRLRKLTQHESSLERLEEKEQK